MGGHIKHMPMHMAPALAGCRMALVVTSHFVSTNRCINHSSAVALEVTLCDDVDVTMSM